MALPTRFIFEGGQGEIVEKRSRFIASIAPVASEEEAQAFVERVKKQYWDARHNCSAMVIGEHGELTRCSDDGEPPHTAGRPMLDILLGEGLTGVCVVVTRYFGGILLGTGGLVRAYQAAVVEGLKHCRIAEQRMAVPVHVVTDYTGVGKLLYLAGSGNYPVLSTEYTDQVTADLLLPEEDVSSFEAAMQEATAGKAILTMEKPVRYALIDGEVVLL